MKPASRFVDGLAALREQGLGQSLDMVRRQDLADEDTVLVAVNFRCNNRCRYCMIESEIAQRLPDVDRAVFEAVFAENAQSRQFRRLVISGAEATVRPDLADLAREATTRGGFEIVHLQTNARLLADEALARRLLAAGVREYFVSIAAHTAELDAHITRAPNNFAQMRGGMAKLLALGARVISNTVITADNVAALPAIAAFVIGEGIREAHLWGFIELGDAGQRDQHVRVADAARPLTRAIETLLAAGAEVTVKWFPRCLLGSHGHLLDNHQPQMLIHDAFQERLGRTFGFGCVHGNHCRWYGAGCDGLHERYVERYGDERDVLKLEPA